MSARAPLPPFPGMNPFLEAQPYWEIVHGWFIRELARLHLQAADTAGCDIEVERHVYRENVLQGYILIGKPDSTSVPIRESQLSAGEEPASDGGVAVAKAVRHRQWPVLTEPPPNSWRDYLVIREVGEEPEKVLAVVELVSPSNKDSRTHAKEYRAKIAEYENSQTNFMEIDLLRAGRNPNRDKFPEFKESPYFIYVDRKFPESRREEGHPVSLREPLPKIGLPLGPDYDDLILDLDAVWQAVMTIVWRPKWLRVLNRPIEGPMSDEDRAWVAERLAQWRATHPDLNELN